MHALFCYYCLFCPISILSHTLIQLCTLYYTEMKIIEELSKHVFKKLNALYIKQLKLIFTSSAVLHRRQNKQYH